jgi:hypothetical protein
MPEAAVVEAPIAEQLPLTAPEPTSLGWRAGLPDDLKQKPELATFKTVGDFAKHALEVEGKVGELEKKLGDSIPKLPDDATDEERNTYLDALGRPPKASEYEFDGEDKNAPEWTNFWKDTFYGEGLNKQQGKNLSAKFNEQIQNLIEAQKNLAKQEMTAAEQKLRTELGDKYDTNVELAKRLWQKHGEGEFDKAFASDVPSNRYGMIRFLLKMAALTGEDTSPQAGHSGSSGVTKPEDAWMNMYKNPVGGK